MVDKEPPYADPHVRWCERSENKSRRKTYFCFPPTRFLRFSNYNLAYADYFSVMADENRALKKEYQRDHVHPNVEGYYVMEEVIQKILQK